MKTFIGAIAVAGLLWFGMATASAWKCEFHPEKPNCTPTTTVPSTTVPETTTTVPVTVPETTTTTSTTVPELAPPVSIVKPPETIKLAG